MTTKKATDLALGFVSERETEPYLKLFFGDDTLAKTRDPYGAIDYLGDSTLCELKTRRIKHNLYPTCLIGLNKINVFRQSTKNNYIVYRYTDGLYYIPYDQELFDTFDVDVQDTWRDGRCESSKVVHIPIIHLKPVIL